MTDLINPMLPIRKKLGQPLASFDTALSIGLVIGIPFVFSLFLFSDFAQFFSKDVNDLSQDYGAAYALRHGLSIYKDLTEELYREIVGAYGNPNVHPPFTAVAFFFLSSLDFATVFLIWTMLSLLLLQVQLYLISREFKVSLGGHVLISFAVLFWYPVYYCLGTGQWSILLSFLLTVFWLLVLCKNQLWAGFCLALAALPKLVPGYFVFILLFGRYYRALCCFLILVLLASIVCLVLMPQDVMLYASTIASWNVKTHGAHPVNISITGIVAPIFEGTASMELGHQIDNSTYALVLLISALFAFISLLLIRRAVIARNLTQAFSLSAVSMMLVSPIMWSHMFVLLVIPLLTVAKGKLLSFRSRRILVLITLVLLSLPNYEISRQLYVVEQFCQSPWVGFLILKGPFFGLLILWFALAKTVRFSR